MTDMWDIAAHVEDHPDDHSQRWRLAKKLYAAHEYRHALEHLNVLKNEWTPKLNVRRYLAATYYRLGRYAEAAAELEEARKTWPDEIGVWEQLGHVYQADRRLEEALDVWEHVHAMAPEHTIALKTVKKIKAALASNDAQDAAEKLGISPSELDGTDNSEAALPMPGFICFKCGARNSEEFESCWQCGQPFRQEDAHFLKTPPLEAHGPWLLRPETITFVAMIALAGMLAGAAWLGIRLVLRYRAAMDMPLRSVADLYDQVLAPSRVAAGMLVLVLWPIVLRVLMRLFRTSPVPPPTLIYISGLLLGAVTMLFLLLPVHLLVLAVAAPLFLSLAMLLLAFKIKPGAALAIWALQAVAVGVIGMTVFWLTECYMYGAFINPAAEVQAIHAHLNTPDMPPDTAPVRIPNVITPVRERVRWRSTGSTWLDTHASNVAFTLRTEPESPVLRFQIYEGPELRWHEEAGAGETVNFVYNVATDTTYDMVVTGAENVIVQVLIQSALHFDFLE